MACKRLFILRTHIAKNKHTFKEIMQNMSRDSFFILFIFSSTTVVVINFFTSRKHFETPVVIT